MVSATYDDDENEKHTGDTLQVVEGNLGIAGEPFLYTCCARVTNSTGSRL